MALINCSNCGGKLSDKASTCVHCGTSVEVHQLESEEFENTRCGNCGEIIPTEANVCPSCGAKLWIEKVASLILAFFAVAIIYLMFKY